MALYAKKCECPQDDCICRVYDNFKRAIAPKMIACVGCLSHKEQAQRFLCLNKNASSLGALLEVVMMKLEVDRYTDISVTYRLRASLVMILTRKGSIDDMSIDVMSIDVMCTITVLQNDV